VQPTSLLQSVLAGADDAVRALGGSSVPHWQALIEHAIGHEHDAAPAQLVDALLALDPDPESWLRRAKQAAAVIESEHFSTIAKAMRALRAWLVGGMERSPSAARMVTFLQLLGDREPDVLERTRVFTAALGDDSISTAIRPRALLLLGRRALSAGMALEALDVAREAEAICRAASLEGRATSARRLIGAALLRAGRLDEGLSTLIDVLTTSAPPFEGTHTVSAITPPTEAALDELAAQALLATSTTVAWVRALGEVAETHAHTPLAASSSRHFLQALERIVTSDELATENALLSLMRQASERELMMTLQAADARRPLRGVASRSLSGARLVLRAASASGRWLRWHDDGSLELARGDARRDDERTPLGAQPVPWSIIAALHRHLVPCALTSPSPWPRYYPVQVFGGAPRDFVEGYVGIEVDMGVRTDVLGLRGGDGHAIVDQLGALLARLGLAR
jgi:hypothetical protein